MIFFNITRRRRFYHVLKYYRAFSYNGRLAFLLARFYHILSFFFSFRLHREELNAIEDLRSRQRRLVELNVIEQVWIEIGLEDDIKTKLNLGH